MMAYRRPRGRLRSRVEVLAVMLLGMGASGPAVFARGGSVWVDPPPLENTAKPAPATTPEVRAPAGPKASTPPVDRSTTPEVPSPAGPKASIPSVAQSTTPEVRAPAGPKASIPSVAKALNPEPTRPRLSRPRTIAAPAARKPEPSRHAQLNHPQSQQGPSDPRV